MKKIGTFQLKNEYFAIGSKVMPFIKKKIGLACVILVSLIAGWVFYFFEKTKYKIETAAEAIALKEKSFFLAHQKNESVNSLEAFSNWYYELGFWLADFQIASIWLA